MGTVIVSADHIGTTPNYYEPQRTNNFTLTIDASTISRGSSAKPDPDLSKKIQLSMKSFPFPKWGSEPVVIWFQNEQRKVAGRRKIEAVELVVHDYVDGGTLAALLSWERCVWSPKKNRFRGVIFGARPSEAEEKDLDGSIGDPAGYKRNGVLTLHSPGGDGIREWDFRGMFPNGIDTGDGDYDTNGNILIKLPLSVDVIEERNNVLPLPA